MLNSCIAPFYSKTFKFESEHETVTDCHNLSINTVSTTLNEQFKGAERQVADNVTRRITYFNIPQTIVQK